MNGLHGLWSSSKMNMNDLLTYPKGTVVVVTNYRGIGYVDTIRALVGEKHTVVRIPVFGTLDDIDAEEIAYDYGFIGTVQVWRDAKAILIFGMI